MLGLLQNISIAELIELGALCLLLAGGLAAVIVVAVALCRRKGEPPGPATQSPPQPPRDPGPTDSSKL